MNNFYSLFSKTKAIISFTILVATFSISRAQSYCTPTYANGTGSGDYISLFELVGTGLSSSSSGAPSPYYTFFPNSGATTATLTTGVPYQVKVSGGSYSTCYISMWGDWNNDSIFDASEFVGSSPNVGSLNISFFFNDLIIPNNAVGGPTRLRIRSSDSSPGPGSGDACASTNSPWGESEDYEVYVVPPVPCSGSVTAGNASSSFNSVCQNNPFSLYLTGNTIALGVTHQWQVSTDSVAWTNLGNVQSSTTFSIPSQSQTSHYRCIVTCTNSSIQDTSSAVTVISTPFLNCLCYPQYTDCNGGDYITNLFFANVSDPNLSCASASSGYADRTYIDTIVVTAGQTYTITADIGNGVNGPGVLGAWIDANHDGTFASNEYMNIIPSVNGTNTYSSNILIPYSALGGITRLRLKLDASGSPITYQDPCTSTNYYGLTADYLIDITPAPACTGTINAGAATSNSTAVCVDAPFNLNLIGNDAVSGVSYQWQQSTDAGSTWSNIGAPQTNVPISISTQSVTTYYRCELTCIASSIAVNSTPVIVNQNSFINCYCATETITCTDASISNVTFANIADTPTCSPNGYNDNISGTAANVTAGQSYSISVTVPTNTYPNQFVGLWIDFDHNSTFDYNEYFSLGKFASGTTTANINIPMNAMGGNTRMRLKLEANYSDFVSLYPCTVYGSDGQTIDYLVNITSLPSCSGTPVAGTAAANSASVCTSEKLELSLTGNDQVSNASYLWEYSYDNNIWTTLTSSLTDPHYGLSGQYAITYYRCIVTCSTSGLSDTSSVVTVYKKDPLDCYCTPEPTSCSPNYNITNINFAGINQASSCGTNGYEDYTAATQATVSAGNTYTLTATLGYDFSMETHAWIDYNRNGDFEASEYSYIGYSQGTGIYDVSSSINIPATAVPGLTRMRVRTFYQSSMSDPCSSINGGGKSISGSTPFGETEDYMVNILPPDCSLLNYSSNSVFVISSPTIVCLNSPVEMFVYPDFQPALGLTYQWKSSPDGTTFSDIGTASASSSLTTNILGNTFYMCDIYCNSSMVKSSDSILINTSFITSTVNAITNPSCFGFNNGSASITTTGGMGNLTYSWTPNSSSSNILTNAIAGNYQCIVADTLGCKDTVNFIITEPSQLIISAVKQDISCFGLTDGNINVTVSGGTSPYLFDWSPNVSSTSTATNLSQGTYSCTVLDANGCTTQTTEIIAEPTQITATSTQTNVTCFGGNNGAAVVNATGGTGSLNYFWSHGFGSLTGNSINGNVTANTYTCTITDANACALDYTVSINDGYQIISNITGNSSICQNTTENYSVSITNATGIVTYTWISTNTTQLGNDSVYPYLGSAAGAETISIQVTDINGCSSNNNFTVTVKASTNISGSALTDVSLSPVSGHVILYKYEPFLTQFDSISSTPIDAVGNYSFASITAGSHIVKAVPSANTLQITYGSNAINWKTATIINHGCNVTSTQNIAVKGFVSDPGPGVLTGKIIEAEGFGQKNGRVMKPTIPGGPIGGIIVKGGKNPGGQMLVQTTTSYADGTYTLTGLPLNEPLFILVDIAGLDTNQTYHRTLTLTNDTITNLDFTVDSIFINPIPEAVSVKEYDNNIKKISIYPNPAKDQLNIEYSLTESGILKIDLINIMGQKIRDILPPTYHQVGAKSLNYTFTDLPPGMYFVKVTLNNTYNTIKLIIE